MEISTEDDNEEFVIIFENKQEEEFELINEIDVCMALASWIESEYYRRSNDVNSMKHKSIILWNYANYAYSTFGWILWLCNLYNDPSNIVAATLILYKIIFCKKIST